ncbi:MAG: hypothetical protein FJ382_01145 [Verrucomicrobia bacterium]|nr:hypothetical protein [Verrucomicrobiota bacterium]
MTPRLRLLLAGGLLAALPLRAAGPQVQANAPILNFSLPSFNAQGFRTMLVRGREAVVASKTEARLRDMTLTVFSGDAAARVETVFVSPAATVRLDERVVFGEESVRVVNDRFELLGNDWRYEHDARRILIRNGARVVFQTEIRDLLR